MPATRAALALSAVLLAAAPAGIQLGTPQDTSTQTAATIAPLLHGIAQPARSASISSPLEERLAEITVAEGQRVARGDLLAQLDDRVARASLAVAESRASATAALRDAESRLRVATSNLERMKRAHAENAAGDNELDEATARFDQAKAAVDAASERIDQSARDRDLQHARLEAHALRAPFDGVIVRVLVEEGETPKSSDPIVELVNLDALRVEMHLPAAYYPAIRVGDTYTLHASAPVAQPLDGTVTSIEPVIDAATRTFRCVLSVDNAEARHPAGFTVTIDETQLRARRVAAGLE